MSRVNVEWLLWQCSAEAILQGQSPLAALSEGNDKIDVPGPLRQLMGWLVAAPRLP
jgi:hypothetical protein